MDDLGIIELYFARNEQAIKETDKKIRAFMLYPGREYFGQ